MYRRTLASLERYAVRSSFRRFCHSPPPNLLRNVAIVAHVDHGKTTLVDQLLKQGGLLSKEAASGNARVMDSNNLEQERGITILSKCTSIDYGDIKINIIDTPGHQDFGGEVERILSMVDSVCLLTDVGEGPKPQTKFILEKVLERGFTPLLVLNKVDRAENRIEDCQMEIMELLEKLGADPEIIDDCLENCVYASAKNGWATANPEDQRTDMIPLLDRIVQKIHPPEIAEGEFKMLCNLLEKDPNHGKLLIGRIHSGTLKQGQTVTVINRNGEFVEKFPARRLFIQKGVDKNMVKSASAGDIVRISGSLKATVTDTLLIEDHTENADNSALESDPIDAPLVSLIITSNNSPLRGRDGTKLLMNQIIERLEEEASVNVTIKINKIPEDDAIELCGRGELQLAVLIENLRREGFEMTIAPPKVRFIEEDGVIKEPFETIDIDCDEDTADLVVESLTPKMAEVLKHDTHAGRVRMTFCAPSRAMMGYMQPFRVQTRGTGIIQRDFLEYREYAGDFRKTRQGSLIAMTPGKTTGTALAKLQSKGKLFIKVGDECYEGMIIGEVREMKDMDCNPCKEPDNAQATRDAVGWHTAGVMDGIKRPQFEEALAWLEHDELLEVTPLNIRLRKKVLDWKTRVKMYQQSKNQKR